MVRSAAASVEGYIASLPPERAEVIEKYRVWLAGQPSLMQRIKPELQGKVLVCWCKPAACHGDELAAIADE